MTASFYIFSNSVIATIQSLYAMYGHVFMVVTTSHTSFLVFMAPWLIITGSGLDDWIPWRLLLQYLLITISYNISQSKTRLIHFILLPQFSFEDWLLIYDWTHRKHILYCWQRFFTASLPSRKSRIIVRITQQRLLTKNLSPSERVYRAVT
jgi:hypothetical protein